MKRVLLIIFLGVLLVGCRAEGSPELLKSTQLYLLVDDHKNSRGHYIVYELTELPGGDSVYEIEQLKQKLMAKTLVSLGDFDQQYRPGLNYVILVRKITSNKKNEVTYTFTKTELKL